MKKVLGLASAAITAIMALTLGGQTNALALGGITANNSAPVAESVAYRQCWWEYGVRRCARVYGYGPRRAEDYRTGSGRWWRQMDREGRAGRGS